MSFFRIIAIIQFVLFSSFLMAQNKTLVKVWETDSTFKVPESVFYSPGDSFLYVSNIDGKPNEKDLKGSISKMSLDGKQIMHDWAINFSAPKGMARYKNNLYVADLDELAVVDILSGKTLKRIPIVGAVFLNDVTVDETGIVYVSDSRKGLIHRVENDIPSVFMTDKNNVNGLLAVEDGMYVCVKDTLFKVDKNKKLTVITTGMDESSDGIVRLANKDLIVSCWNGIIYWINQQGQKVTLLDTRKEKINTADIGLDPTTNILYVPTFFHNTIAAYKFQ
ncbi:MAG: ATP/GTP-binding protein [Bacteroidota bacterium]